VPNLRIVFAATVDWELGERFLLRRFSCAWEQVRPGTARRLSPSNQSGVRAGKQRSGFALCVRPSGKKELDEMKIHRAWIRATAAAAIAVGTQAALGQYAPYGEAPRYSDRYPTETTTVAPYGVTPTPTAPVYPTTNVPNATTTSPAVQQQVTYPTASTTVPPAPPVYPQTQPPQYPAQMPPAYQAQRSGMRPGYPAMARMTPTATNGNIPTPASGEMLPTPANGATSGDGPMNGGASTYDPSYGAGCNCGGYPGTAGYYGGGYGGTYGSD
jgi:hypothetical protein